MRWERTVLGTASIGAVLLLACGEASPGGDDPPEDSRFEGNLDGWEKLEGRRTIDPPAGPGSHPPTGFPSAPGSAGSGGAGGAGGTGGVATVTEVCDDGWDNDANGFTDCLDWQCGGKSVCDCDPGDLACEAERLVRFWVFDRFFINGDDPVLEDRKLVRELLAKAQPDECFEGLNGGPAVLDDAAYENGIECEVGRPKVNQAYVWSLTHTGDALWFGTIANTLCLVEQGFLGVNAQQETDYWVCEFGITNGRPGDWRLPEIYVWDLKEKKLKQKLLTGPALQALSTVTGLRAAGNAGGVVFLAGPRLPGFGGGIVMFAFEAETGDFLGFQAFPTLTDIRSFLTYDGVLYAGVGTDPDLPTDPGGFVLRWFGDANDPFDFEIVGTLDSEAANLAVHEGRIYVTTWPVDFDPQRVMALYQSPKIPPGGLPPSTDRWTELWSITDYDPDLVTALVTGGGALASFDGKLFWGTMNVPFLATAVAVQALNLDTDPLNLLVTALGTHRSISIFRAEDLEGPYPKISLVYGEKFLPFFDPQLRYYTIRYDAEHKNRLGKKPLFGSSGVGNFFNAYTWSMQTFDDQLYVGTFDWSQVARVGLQDLLGLPQFESLPSTMMLKRLGAIIPREGADLFRFKTKTGPWIAESLTGVGNDTNYGVRTMVADEHALYIGTANPMNLHPDGGWELLKMTPKDKKPKN